MIIKNAINRGNRMILMAQEAELEEMLEVVSGTGAVALVNGDETVTMTVPEGYKLRLLTYDGVRKIGRMVLWKAEDEVKN